MNPRISNWYMQNVRALRKMYGKVQHCSNYTWILIHYYQLPPYFNVNDSALLITTPGDNLTIKDGFSFYLNKRLIRTDGKPTLRLHDEGPYNPYANHGYSRLSFHLYDFRPSVENVAEGDTFIDMCESLYTFLGDERGIL